MTNNYQILVDKLKLYCRKFYLLQLLKGFLLLISIVFIYFSVVYFIEFELYTSSWWRFFFLVGIVFLLITVAFCCLLLPLSILLGFKKLSKPEQAALVSSHFPDLNDRLINIIELGELENTDLLVISSIDQKIKQLTYFQFKAYFSFKLVRKAVLLFAGSLFLGVLLAFVFPGIYSQVSYRLIHFNQRFIKPAPFTFIFNEQSLQIRKGSSVQLAVQCAGNRLPENLYVNIGGSDFLMDHQDSLFVYTLKHVQNEFSIYFTDLTYLSDKYRVKVIPDPVILSFKIQVDVPDYTRLPDLNFDNNGNIKVPVGSNIHWDFECADADCLKFRMDGKTYVAEKKGGVFSLDYQALNEFEYHVLLSNAYTIDKKLITFNVQLIPDLFPDIRVVQLQDSVQMNRFYFKGNIGDDYGFHDLVFNLKSDALDSVIYLPVDKNIHVQDFYYFFDFKTVRNLGSSFHYYFAVRDNDYPGNFKRSVSDVFNFTFPTSDQLNAQDRQLYSKLEDSFAETKRLTDELNKVMDELKYRSISDKLSDWEKQQLMQNVIHKRNELEKSLEMLRSENSLRNNLNNSFGDQQKELLEKQQQIEELMKDIMSDELQQLFDEFNKLAQHFDQDRFNQLMEQMDSPMNDLAKQLDRNLEMLKRLKIEQTIQKAIDDLHEIALKEEQNIQNFNVSDNFDVLLEEEGINELHVDSLSGQLNDMQHLNNELDKRLNIFPVDDEFRSIQQKFKDIRESIQRKRKSGLKKEIPENKALIDNLAFSLQQMLNHNQFQQNGENIANLQQILKNLVYVSLHQEDILNLCIGLSLNDPMLHEVQNKQDLIVEQSKQLQDSLYALAKRTPAITSKINSELLMIDYSVQKSTEGLKNGLMADVVKSQQVAITSLNELALFLNEVLENLEQMMANSMPGDQECDKPGKGGKSSLDHLKKTQQSLKDQMQRMIDDMKSGKNGKLSEQIGKTLIHQELMKQMVREAISGGDVGSSAKEQLKSIEQIIEQNRVDLIQKNITNRMVVRQNLILDRLLKAEKAELERDIDDKRESKTAAQLFYSNPNVFFEYNKTEKNREEDIRFDNLRLRSFYDQKFRSYINQINQ